MNIKHLYPLVVISLIILLFLFLNKNREQDNTFDKFKKEQTSSDILMYIKVNVNSDLDFTCLDNSINEMNNKSEIICLVVKFPLCFSCFENIYKNYSSNYSSNIIVTNKMGYESLKTWLRFHRMEKNCIVLENELKSLSTFSLYYKNNDRSLIIPLDKGFETFTIQYLAEVLRAKKE